MKTVSTKYISFLVVAMVAFGAVICDAAEQKALLEFNNGQQMESVSEADAALFGLIDGAAMIKAYAATFQTLFAKKKMRLFESKSDGDQTTLQNVRNKAIQDVQKITDHCHNLVSLISIGQLKKEPFLKDVTGIRIGIDALCDASRILYQSFNSAMSEWYPEGIAEESDRDFFSDQWRLYYVLHEYRGDMLSVREQFYASCKLFRRHFLQ